LRKPTTTFTAGLLAAVLGLFSAPTVRAQDWVGIMTYQISYPTDETAKFIDDISYAGLGLDMRKHVGGGVFLSVGMAWNVFHEREEDIFQFGHGAVSGSQDHYLNIFPIMVGVHKYLGKPRSLRVHAGVNAGGYLYIQTLRIGVSEFEEDTWEWGVAPEVGMAVPIQTGLWLVVNGRYQWSPTPETLIGEDTELTYYQVNIGFMWEQ
jgi:hypothetical protein